MWQYIHRFQELGHGWGLAGRKRWRGITLPTAAPLRWGNKLSDDFGPHDNFSIEFLVFLWDTSFPVCPVSTTFFWPHYAWDLSSLTSVEPIPLLWKSENEVAQSCPTLWDPMDGSLPGSSIHRIFQARVVEWAAISFSRGSSQSRDRTWVSCIADKRFTAWPLGKPCFGRGVLATELPGKSLLTLLTVFLHPWPSFTLSAWIQDEFRFSKLSLVNFQERPRLA